MPRRLVLAGLAFGLFFGHLPSPARARELTRPLFITESDLGPNRTYTLQEDLSAPGTAVFIMVPDATIELAGHTITFGTDDRDGTVGVYPFDSRTAFPLGADDVNYPETLKPAHGARCTVQNGRVVWAGKKGKWATAVGGAYSKGPITVRNCSLSSGGPDGACVHFNWAALVIHDCYCFNTSSSTENRHAGPANVWCGGKTTAYRNILIGGCSAFHVGSGSEAHENVMRQSGFATNGYGFGSYRGEDCQVYRNLIVPTNGRGVIFDHGRRDHVYENFICVHEKPNAEFGTALNAPCVRLRYDATENEFLRNECLAIGGPGGGNAAASGAYFTCQPGTQNLVAENEFIAIAAGDPVPNAHYANALTFEGQGKPGGPGTDRVERNRLAGNNYLIRLSGYDGGCFQNPIVGNSLEWISGRAAAEWAFQILDSPRFQFQYPDDNRYVTAETLQSIRTSVKAEILELIGQEGDDRKRAVFYTGYNGHPSSITLLETKLRNVKWDDRAIFVEKSNAKAPIDIRIGESATGETIALIPAR
ncbi:MAG: hypothetical protein JO317_00685 [Verrucomicrobiae bacterium]|nr:hypothetical protein [Verrucomicrobiae bacterium]